jgi:DNA-binding MurR/RpiR family transcriptional regulator
LLHFFARRVSSIIMTRGAPILDRMIADFDRLPEQLRGAARYILDNPRDVALLSMREQARRAGVKPWTMTRLAKRLGLKGYEAIRSLHAEAIRNDGDSLALGFSDRAGAQVERQSSEGDLALSEDMMSALAGQFRRLGTQETHRRLIAAADLLVGAGQIHCVGLRSSRSVAEHFAHLLSFLGERARPVHGDLDSIRFATPDDAVLAVSVSPYTRRTVEIVRYARDRGVPVVAITDSAVSPLAQMSRVAILVPTDGPSFFQTLTPAFAAAEILAAIVAGRGGKATIAALDEAERQYAALDIHWNPKQGNDRQRPPPVPHEGKVGP